MQEEGEGMGAEWPTATTTADNLAADRYEQEWRRAVAESLKELLTAVAQIREQNAAYEAHRQETDRRLEKVEQHLEQASVVERQTVVEKLKARIDLDWRIVLAASGWLLWIAQSALAHVTLH
jgi:hypothetical protein